MWYNIRNSSHQFGASGIIVAFKSALASVRLMFEGLLVGHYNTIRPSVVFTIS